MPKDGEQKTMTVEEAAKELAVTQTMIYYMIRKGKLEQTSKGVRGPEGSPARVSAASVDAFKKGKVARLAEKMGKLQGGNHE